ncbi:MAG TPA: cytidine deaminase [Candidatus Baltobacteraceae bacterium]|jgi:cytidine deaminase
MSSDELLEHAKRARANAYAPYSKFAVGAAVDVGNGTVVIGANVENASYGLSLCAERVALSSAIAAGHRTIRAIAIAGPEATETAPCGACRQFIAEFDPAMPVTFTTAAEPLRTTLAELLPHAFGPRALT